MPLIPSPARKNGGGRCLSPCSTGSSALQVNAPGGDQAPLKGDPRTGERGWIGLATPDVLEQTPAPRHFQVAPRALGKHNRRDEL
jgi:hypothetical protein